MLHHVSQCRKPLKKNGIRKFCPSNFFNLAFLYQNEGSDNLKTRKFEVIKIRGKSVAGEKDGKGDNWILHVSYQLPVMLSTFSSLVYINFF